MKLDQIVKIRLESFGLAPEDKMDITPNPCWEGYEPIGLKEDGSPNCVPIKAEKMETKVNLADYPWEVCIADQIKQYGDEEIAKRVCGAIKALYAERQEMGNIVKDGFPIPSPEGGEDEQAYVSRCIGELYNEYGQEQAAAICYAKWREK